MCDMVGFDAAVDRCIEAFGKAVSPDQHCMERYVKAVSVLESMRAEVKASTYPRDYAVLPLFHYVERHMDPEGLYEAVKELDVWYAENYRKKKQGQA